MFKGDRNFSVGLFVTVAIVVFVAFVIWLTGRSGAEEMDRYSLRFHRDVSGLAVGGPVKYMGMNVGSVIHMAIETGDGVRVRVDIEILATTPVNRGTYASLALQGITGVAVVNLASEAGTHGPLPHAPRGEYPEIPVRDVGFAALLSSAPQIMNKLDDLLSKAADVLSEDNRGTINETLQNVEDLTASLAGNRDELAALPRDLHATLAGIQSAVDQLRDVIVQIRPELDNTLDNMSESSANLASLTGRLDGLLREHEKDMGRFMEQGLGEAPALLAETRTMLRELEKLVGELREDPSRLIHRPPTEALEMDP